MNRWLDCIQIWYGSLGISDNLFTFWYGSIKNKMAHYFLILMDRAYVWGVLPSIDGFLDRLWHTSKHTNLVITPCKNKLPE